ncbi:uncharacterized protein LOC127877746 [Dreissena polymorpha]|uniref:uncharacterized protein LOC127877746 n=1 Tax=Dreissena polymorpha TaxID=45954 RepID=UPI002265556E|nr:uncharacterized protein LOC127877746 [Dreissena polymorpha]
MDTSYAIKGTVCIAMIAILADMCNSMVTTTYNIPGYFKWTGQGHIHDYLYCPNVCQNQHGFENLDECCGCKARPCWDLEMEDPNINCGVRYGHLILEFKNPISTVATHSDSIPKSSNYSVIYGLRCVLCKLRYLPENLCNFTNGLIDVDLSHNKLSEVDAIKCLTNLDTLNLGFNHIIHIKNTTLHEMNYLRVLRLDGNNLANLDANTLNIRHGNILFVDVSYNHFETLDITNLHRPGFFCALNISNMNIKSITNDAHFKFDENETYGPGDTFVYNTYGYSLLNYTDAGITDIKKTGKILLGAIFFKNSPFSCDCALVPYIMELKFWIVNFFNLTDYQLVCNEPLRVRNRSLYEIIINEDYSELSCELPNCPFAPDKNYPSGNCSQRAECTCSDDQFHGRVIVNCSNLDEMPGNLPVGHWNNQNIELNINGSTITHIDSRPYLDRTVALRMLDVPLSDITKTALQAMPNDMQLSIDSQQITLLSEGFLKMNPYQIQFGKNPVTCTCDNLWIGTWIRAKGKREQLLCRTTHGVIDAYDVDHIVLDCTWHYDSQLWAIVGLVTVTLVFTSVGALFWCMFRNEMLILKRKYLPCKQEHYPYTTDVFISFYSANPYVFTYMERFLRPMLITEGYSVFDSFHDIEYNEEDFDFQLTQAVSKCKNFLIILCEDYLTDEKTCLEFDTIWKHFEHISHRPVIIVNFNSADSSEISDRRIRAFLRLKQDLNFKNTNTQLIEELKARLCAPIASAQEDEERVAFA